MSASVQDKPARVRLKAGASVTFKWGFSPVHGVIVEDRGPLGQGGRRLYVVRFRLEGVDEPLTAELPEDVLAPISAGK